MFDALHLRARFEGASPCGENLQVDCRWCGTGIAMGRHSEKVGEVASMVTGTVKEEGITMALKKLGLI